MPKNEAKSPKATKPKTERNRTSKARAPKKPKAPKRTRTDAARENGARGGRPRKDPHLEDFLELGEPPAHPLKAIRWQQQLLGLCSWQVIQGRGRADVRQELRALAREQAKLIPADVTVEALRLLDEEHGRLEADTGPIEVDADELGEPTGEVLGL